MIRRETKKNILDHLDMENIHFSGRMSEINFLQRLYNLEEMESYDDRYETALSDIVQHTVNNSDYEGNWVFHQSRFKLLDGSNETFLKFISEMAHPLVRPDSTEASRIIIITNDWLKEDGWELYPVREIAGGKLLSYRQINATQKPKDSEVAHIWDQDKLKFFISHRDKHKTDAKQLGEDLKKFGISSFVAHDSIQAMSTWKHEIMKALQTMDACLCYITKDFYESEWTNQEVGFALARGVPIYLYSVDRTDPRGFKLDTQAIKTGPTELINCIKKDFSNNDLLKKFFIERFIDARDGSFSLARERFFDLVGLKFNDQDIEIIAGAIAEKGGKREPVNKLHAILQDGLEEKHKAHPNLKKCSTYMEYLKSHILAGHSKNLFSFKKVGEWNYELVKGEKAK